MINNNHKKIISLCFLFFFVGCSSTEDKQSEVDNTLTVDKSFLKGTNSTFRQSDVAQNNIHRTGESSLEVLPPLNRSDVFFKSSQLAVNFSDTALVSVAANDMPLALFIQYVYSDLLKVNYLLSPDARNVQQKVTLNLKDNISQRKLFTIAETVLAERGLRLKYNDNVYLISKIKQNSKSATQVGMGRTSDTIPQGNRKILQVVPILYGIKVSIKNTIEQLADVAITIDVKQSALFISGDYSNVVRALELVQLLDSPANRGRHIGVVKLIYSSPDIYLQQLSTLLENEGVPNSINTPGNNNLVFVPLPQIGAVAIFSATKELLDRVTFWTKILDKPSEGDVKQYFVFHPQFARAQDIGESLTPLISAKTNAVAAKITTTANANQKDSQGNRSGQLSKSSRKTGAANNELAFVVDERSNALIFYTTGTEYRNIIPLINRLDVLPKQVMLDIVVAEVLLTDNFKFGVKWAIENNSLTGGTLGAVSAAEGGFSFILNNSQGETMQAAFSQDDTNVKILSNPSILVRDGVTATLDIGTDIAIVDSTTEGFEDTSRVTTSNSYRKTGIRISVTPTINAKGVVIMDIEESISNEVESTATAGGNPNIFERNLVTAVVAESGQTIILGGLIDEKTTIIENKVPGLGDLPLLGHLFKSQSDKTTKTELVLMVTPKVISRADQWGSIMSSFEQKLDKLKIITE
jgi:general secretion pathway protein D